MAEPVTTAELAEALRELIGVTFNAVGTTERLRVFDASSETLSRFDVQQFEERKRAQHPEPSKPAMVPTCSCPIADTGDFDECCIVCGESTDGGHSPDRCIENIEHGIRQIIEFEREQLEASKPALSEVEQAAHAVATSWSKFGFSDSTGASGPSEWRSFARELNCLRDALRKSSAL